jgi:cytochrome b involved in lipid metabolism
MNKRVVLAILVVALVIGMITFIRLSVPSTSSADDLPSSVGVGTSAGSETTNSANSGTTTGSSSGSASEPIANGKITATQLATHNTRTDCWIAYNGKVYDITSFLPNHKGSAAAIAPYCGTSNEFKQAFEGQHGTSKVAGLLRVGTLIGDFDIVGTEA